jgi:hypothetical protein
MMKTIFRFILIGLVLLRCNDPNANRKIDPYLKVIIENMVENSQTDKKIQLIFKINDELSDAHKKVLEKKGITLQATLGNICTASATMKSVYELAQLRFVTSIEPSKELLREHRTSPE